MLSIKEKQHGERQPKVGGRAASCLGGLITVFFLSFLADQANASCGNYLYRNGKPVAHHMIQNHPIRMDEVLQKNVTGHSEPVSPMPVRRCFGPHCSSSPVPLLPINSVPEIQLRSLDPAALLSLIHGTFTAWQRHGLPESERGVHYVPSSIFRPPTA